MAEEADEDSAEVGAPAFADFAAPAMYNQRERDLLRAARLLQEQGLGHLVPDMLKGAGLDPDLLRRVTAEDLGVADTADAERVHGQEAEPVTAAEPVTDAGAVQGSPWDDGNPPLLARLLVQGRFALAAGAGPAYRLPPDRERLLRFCCAAYACSSAVLASQLPELVPPAEEIERLTADECRVLLSAGLRASHALGYSPMELSALTRKAQLHNDGIATLVMKVAEATTDARRSGTMRAIDIQVDLGREWAEFEGQARQLTLALAKRDLGLVRATGVLHELVRPDQPVRQALDAVTEYSADWWTLASGETTGAWPLIEQMAAELATADGRTSLIKAADRALRGSRPLQPVSGKWRVKLDESLAEVANLLKRFSDTRSAFRVAAAAHGLGDVSGFFHSVGRLPDAAAVSTVGEAALFCFVGWLRAGAPAASGGTVDELVGAELAPLYEIPRDRDGRPARPPTPAEIAHVISGRSAQEVMRGYLAAGDVGSARAAIARVASPERAALDEQIDRHSRELRDEHARALDMAVTVAARLRAVSDEAGAIDVSTRAESLRSVPGERYDLTIEPLRQLAREGEARHQEFREELRRQALQWLSSEADTDRSDRLIDEVVASEFLDQTYFEATGPDANGRVTRDFTAFFPAVIDLAVQTAADGGDVIEAVRATAGVSGDPANQRLAHGLNAWRVLKSNKRAIVGDKFRARVADVLRMIGIVPRNQNWLREVSRTQRSGYATLQVRATPIDRSYVPSLGTQANSDYDLTLIWDEVTPARLLDLIDERRRTRPNIVLYFHTLSVDQRLSLRAQTTAKGFSPIVIDEPVAAWLSASPEPGWRLTQRLTLPFTTLSPYVPFALGEVPDEVFVGRERERQQIESPSGAMFVYGGRQLGKSALLRRVERLFTDPEPPMRDDQPQPRSGHVAIYLDLKANSIGEAREPGALWTELARQLRRTRVLPAISTRSSPTEVTTGLLQWLNRDDGNRLLLLLDEADSFLTADSHPQEGRSGFPTLRRLMSLMESSGRRFKAVFAGLHQVQRFYGIPNTPMAHSGKEVLIGPLRSADAYRLVVEPMSALGYEFASPEVVWKLLLFTNYQAGLVQISSDALVHQLSRRRPPRESWPIVVTDDDVESVYANREVRDLIAQRFWWTINLDSRYRVIALVVAALSRDDALGQTFDPALLYEECGETWSAGFAPEVLSIWEFHRYLDEMVGLGVLRRADDEYGLRSPHVVSLMGDRQIELGLKDAARELELATEYNQALNHRIMDGATELWAPRSPLTDRDIVSLLDERASKRVHVVTGSVALGLDRVAPVLLAVAAEQRIQRRLANPTEIDELLAKSRQRTHFVVDLTKATPSAADLSSVCGKLADSGNDWITATVIVNAAALPLPEEIHRIAGVLPLRRWSAEGLRSWYDSPFQTADLRARLHRGTSGWPLLVEETMRSIAKGQSPDGALELIARELADPYRARLHLTACGIAAELAKRWASQFAVRGDDGLVEAFPASLAEITEATGTDAAALIEALEALDVATRTSDGWLLDRVVTAAAMTVVAEDSGDG